MQNFNILAIVLIAQQAWLGLTWSQPLKTRVSHDKTHMGLVARKPVFGGLRTTQVWNSLFRKPRRQVLSWQDPYYINQFVVEWHQVIAAYGNCSKFLSFEHFSFSVLSWNIGYQGWNSENTHQNSKQGRPWSDCFCGSSLIWVYTVCRDLFDRQLVFEILEHLPVIHIIDCQYLMWRWINLWLCTILGAHRKYKCCLTFLHKNILL